MVTIAFEKKGAWVSPLFNVFINSKVRSSSKSKTSSKKSIKKNFVNKYTGLILVIFKSSNRI